MTAPDTPSRLETIPAYVLSAITTLLWVACVLPSGTLAQPDLNEDWATPLHREPILLVPALLLLIAVPTACTISRYRRGMRGVLASTDAFVMCYTGIALLAEGLANDLQTLIGIVLLFAVGALSILEAIRCTRQTPPDDMGHSMAGLRLALCIMVLVVPMSLLIEPNVERASLLAPFVFVAISAAGARLARDMRGLRRTAALLQLLLAMHLVVTIRYTIYRAEPTLADVNMAGRVTMGLCLVVAGFALLQLLLLMRPRKTTAGALDGTEAAQPATG